MNHQKIAKALLKIASFLLANYQQDEKNRTFEYRYDKEHKHQPKSETGGGWTRSESGWKRKKV